MDLHRPMLQYSGLVARASLRCTGTHLLFTRTSNFLAYYDIMTRCHTHKSPARYDQTQSIPKTSCFVHYYLNQRLLFLLPITHSPTTRVDRFQAHVTSNLAQGVSHRSCKTNKHRKANFSDGPLRHRSAVVVRSTCSVSGRVRVAVGDNALLIECLVDLVAESS